MQEQASGESLKNPKRGRDPDDTTTAVGSGPAKKRRRTSKSPERKFECPAEGCGKSYSRAEHLYRHQLNHTPKQIYHCDFPGCQRSFVRHDLCVRHRERHESKSSQLHRGDSSLQSPSYASPERPKTQNGGASQTTYQATDSDAMLEENGTSEIARHRGSDEPFDVSSPRSSRSRSERYAHLLPPLPGTGLLATSAPFVPPSFLGSHSLPSLPVTRSPEYTYPLTGETQMQQQELPQMPPLPLSSSSAYMDPSGDLTDISTMAGPNMSTNGMNHADLRGDNSTLDQLPSAVSYPGSGEDAYGQSAFGVADDFTAWLFNDQWLNGLLSPTAEGGINLLNSTDFPSPESQSSNINRGLSTELSSSTNTLPNEVSIAFSASSPESTISEGKRQHLLNIALSRASETDRALLQDQKDELLSTHMLENYIAAFWKNVHPQMPILHRPTFVPDDAQILLLLAIIVLGAMCFEKGQDRAEMETCIRIANILAELVRWEIFRDADFSPPTRLWVFQALVLLELYEKTASTRTLHERAHIHHATTLTLLRRGASLITRNVVEPPPMADNDKPVQGGSAELNSLEEWWRRWRVNEATRRVSFAAFIIDATHATMFGHSAVMIAHEMRLPLPCDEALWAAPNSKETRKIEAALRSQGGKPVLFHEGLKKTFNGQSVKTNPFGRMVLMAGLLNVGWHMNQRDLQVSSLGATRVLGGRDKWRGSLTRAIDFWKTDFDDAIKSSLKVASLDTQDLKDGDTERATQSKCSLFSLAQMAMHVDFILDCQIFAGMGKLLGRSITSQDYQGAQRRMKEAWAPTARARTATFHALKFLSQILILGEQISTSTEGTSQSGTTARNNLYTLNYCAQDDFLLNRPWVIYWAALITWCYGYALDGKVSRSIPPPVTREEQVRDMQGFLKRVGGVKTPDELQSVRNRNSCLGLLMLLRDDFAKARWELLREASNLFENCIEMLMPIS